MMRLIHYLVAILTTQQLYTIILPPRRLVGLESATDRIRMNFIGKKSIDSYGVSMSGGFKPIIGSQNNQSLPGTKEL